MAKIIDKIFHMSQMAIVFEMCISCLQLTVQFHFSVNNVTDVFNCTDHLHSDMD